MNKPIKGLLKMVTKLILVRHGETYENVMKVSQGHMNTQLTEKGIRQAKEVAEKLKDEKVDFCYCSDLDRCLDTAKEIVKFHPHLKIIPVKELREQAKGKSEGQKHEVVYAKFDQANVPYHLWDYGGGETLLEVSEKVISFVDSLKKKHPKKTILLVSHGGPISALLVKVNNESLTENEKYQFKNTEFKIIDYNSNLK
jgi:broad specificity phosphatase PhoE